MKINKKIIYIAGRVTGKDSYWTAFEEAESLIKGAFGWGNVTILNPTVLPIDFEYVKAMNITTAMVKESDMVVMLDDWKQSKGATLERNLAEVLGIEIVEIAEIRKLWSTDLTCSQTGNRSENKRRNRKRRDKNE